MAARYLLYAHPWTLNETKFLSIILVYYKLYNHLHFLFLPIYKWATIFLYIQSISFDVIGIRAIIIFPLHSRQYLCMHPSMNEILKANVRECECSFVQGTHFVIITLVICTQSKEKIMMVLQQQQYLKRTFFVTFKV